MYKIKYAFFWLGLICAVVFLFQNVFSWFNDLFVLNVKALYGFEFWRFFTAIFLHGSIVHLLYNLFALLFFGLILEKKVGTKNFLIIFFIGGIVGNIVGVNFYSSSFGASGAIYGILGCLAVIEPLIMIFAFGMPMPMFLAAIIWIIGDVMGVFGFGAEDVGYIAHLGGVCFGIVYGIFYRILFFKPKKKEDRIIIPSKHIFEWEEKWMK